MVKAGNPSAYPDIPLHCDWALEGMEAVTVCGSVRSLNYLITLSLDEG